MWAQCIDLPLLSVPQLSAAAGLPTMANEVYFYEMSLLVSAKLSY